MASESNRRSFLKKFAVAAAAVPVASKIFGRGSLAFAADPPKGKPVVKESDPQAKSFRYHEDHTKVDPKTNPKYVEGAHCATCQLYTAANESWGSCTMFGGKIVNTNGWCMLYNKRPEKK